MSSRGASGWAERMARTPRGTRLSKRTLPGLGQGTLPLVWFFFGVGGQFACIQNCPRSNADMIPRADCI